MVVTAVKFFHSVLSLHVSSIRAMNECNEAGNRQHEYVMQSTAIVARGDSVSDKNQSLPFEKRSLVGKTIESMEVFQVMPQKPHFRPLDNCEEYVGSAIGLMVTFAGMVERTAKLKFGDSRSIIDRSLRTLLELGIHGFDVESVRGCLSELLSKKERQGELQEKSKEVEKEILKRMQEKTKIAEEIYEIGKKQRELEKKIVLTTLKNEMKDKEIAVLQTKLDVIGEDLRSAQRDFGRLTASPW
ncbi:hypothetical protein F0562_018060 [Nyssa sinensis]|uniref:Uncharacterized protein n=1 Tax=Nyssa sinensis TaxID=561372 RepID=A0A5J4ZCA7_9ASTE|nr:hypothetical protein F0562_018060 [Nyssa sinensis]